MEDRELTPSEVDIETAQVEFPNMDLLDANNSGSSLINEHKHWLTAIRHEKPSPKIPYKVAVYIRYFNQTKYSNYLDYHKQQYINTLAEYPGWDFVGFYIDEGSTAPNMENAPGWSELLKDCEAGKVNLIITQKVSNVSKKMHEIIFCARMLAAQTPPVGIYFISEDLFTLASYYQEDLRDTYFLPSPDWKLLPQDDLDIRGKLND